jgi:hypothetical protein
VQPRHRVFLPVISQQPGATIARSPNLFDRDEGVFVVVMHYAWELGLGDGMSDSDG